MGLGCFFSRGLVNNLIYERVQAGHVRKHVNLLTSTLTKLRVRARHRVGPSRWTGWWQYWARCVHTLRVASHGGSGSERRWLYGNRAVYRVRAFTDTSASWGLIRNHQLAMPGLFNVIKYICHELPPLADEKKTYKTTTNITFLSWIRWMKKFNYSILNTLSLRSQRNLSLWAFLCMKTPSKCPLSTLLISMALLPQPMICPVPMYATLVGISPHCSTIVFDTLPYVLT